ncbi:ureidoglycolate lyase [Rhizobiales bacterium TNE-4]|nr:ureidoglycolate lyase [Rhizobiales bacterium TNE-4]MBV1826489.1 ureidoglycolate lyase [Rhizobiales bacterium TNE-4]
MNITAQPISASAFARYGTLIDAGIDVPRLNFAVPVENVRETARANLCIVRPPVITLPFTVDTMERHAFSTQAFFPLDSTNYLLVVAEGDDRPDLATAAAFLVPGTQAISYRRGVWHIGMAVLDAPCGMAMLVHEDGSARDTDYVAVPPFTIV